MFRTLTSRRNSHPLLHTVHSVLPPALPNEEQLQFLGNLLAALAKVLEVTLQILMASLREGC